MPTVNYSFLFQECKFYRKKFPTIIAVVSSRTALTSILETVTQYKSQSENTCWNLGC